MTRVAVPVAKLQRWTQVDAKSVAAEASVALSGVPSSFRVSGISAPAAAGISGSCSSIVALGADAPSLIINTSLGLFAKVDASAAVEIDATASALRDTFYANASATAAIAAPAKIDSVPLNGVADFLVIPPAVQVAPQAADAVVSMEYYGDGSIPIFPFRLPILFVGIDFSNIVAEAVVDPEGDADVEVGVGAAATVPVIAGGVNEVLGTVSIFPFTFPAVFDDTSTVRVGGATIGFAGDIDILCDLSGEADAKIVAVGEIFFAAVFPTRFPFILREIIGDAVADVFSAVDASAVVDGDAAVDVIVFADTE